MLPKRHKGRKRPRTGSPTIRYPAAGTRCISILPNAPTKRISASGCISLRALAMLTAGKIWPPVPPPLITNLSFSSIFVNLLLQKICQGTDTARASAADASGDLRTVSAVSSIFLAVRLTLNIIPTHTQLIRILEPPLLMRGRGWPVTGIAPTATAILTKACSTIIKASPITR